MIQLIKGRTFQFGKLCLSAMDNLYNSAAFCRAAFNHKWKVLCHGVARKGNRGIPACVSQQEVISRKDQVKVKGTVKAAVLEGDEGRPNLIASSVCVCPGPLPGHPVTDKNVGIIGNRSSITWKHDHISEAPLSCSTLHFS